MTICKSGRGREDVSIADVFSWNELPELLAAEDLFELSPAAGLDRAAIFAAKDDDDFEDEDEDEEWDEEDDDEEWDDEDEEDDEEEDEEDEDDDD